VPIASIQTDARTAKMPAFQRYWPEATYSCARAASGRAGDLAGQAKAGLVLADGAAQTHGSAGLFDLDGVLTNTAAAHDKAWKEMFDAFLRERAERTGEPFVPHRPQRVGLPGNTFDRCRADQRRVFLNGMEAQCRALSRRRCHEHCLSLSTPTNHRMQRGCRARQPRTSKGNSPARRASSHASWWRCT